MDAKSSSGAKADTTKKRSTREMKMAVTAPGPSLSSLDDMCSEVVVVCFDCMHDVSELMFKLFANEN